MILKTEELASHRKKFAMVDGCFDPLHHGHVKYFEEAAAIGLPLLCNVQGDGYINRAKQRPTILPEDQRARLIDALKPISAVHICQTSTHQVLEALQPAKYVKGADWKGRGLPELEQEVCRKYGIEIVYLDTVLDSSTNLAAAFAKGASRSYVSGRVAEFEDFVLNQKPFEAEYYDKAYFEGEWRKGEESYSLEKRRAIEARNPHNIRDTFNPEYVLDVGCGPGALMLFMHELGLKTYGIDFSQSARDIAPEAIRKNIHVGDVNVFHDFGVKFDLVVCREMIEHLTVLQVRKVVGTLARYTEKFLYVTTRFHPDPPTLLDVTTEPLVDPSHITCMNKEFLRILFVLEGLKSRPDLERKMDWKNYGRVMVFEKVGG